MQKVMLINDTDMGDLSHTINRLCDGGYTLLGAVSVLWNPLTCQTEYTATLVKESKE